MAATLPANKIGLDARYFKPGAPIRDGYDTSPEERHLGGRGISDEANFAHANCVRTIGTIPYRPDELDLFGGVITSTSFGARSRLLVRIGAEVAKIRCRVDQLGGDIEFYVDNNAGGSISGSATSAVYTTREVLTVTLTLTDVTGYAGWVELRFRRDSTTTKQEVFGVQIQEVPMVAGDF